MPEKKSVIGRVCKWLFIAGLLGVLVVAVVAGYLYHSVSKDLPPVESLKDVQLQIPLRVYTRDGELIAEYGEKRREPSDIHEVPAIVKEAILAAEDDQFYSHIGVSFKGLARAAINLIKTGEKGQGGSTITMQVARNFFLSSEKTYSRKLNEILLALKIEQTISKDDILELYINKIYLGNRSYGFAAASRVYYGKPIQDVNIAEAAMLAGLPKAPSRYNPIINPERALLRRNYVLRRLRDLEWISETDFATHIDAPVTAKLNFSKPDAEAHYVGEMARARIKALYGDLWSTAGLHVYTTLDGAAQRAANSALRNSLFEYEKRHGFTGAIGNLTADIVEDPEALVEALDEFPTHGGLVPAVTVSVSTGSATFRTADALEFTLPFEEGLSWARERVSIDERGEELSSADQVVRSGDVVYLWEDNTGNVSMVQEPQIEGAFVALDSNTGSIRALVGGFDFRRSKFNRVTQAKRQPGSTFKPFIYSAALEKGDTAATIYNDAPVVFHDDALEGEWRPSNYSGRFFGPTRLREALVKSRNLVSIRVLREIGIEYAIEHSQRFGFTEAAMPPDLSLALGSASVSPLELAAAFGTFANVGYRVTPYFIERIEDAKGNIVYEAPQVQLCDTCDLSVANPLQQEIDSLLGKGVSSNTSGSEVADSQDGKDGIKEVDLSNMQHPVSYGSVEAARVLEQRNAYIMRSMLQEVTRRGTGRKAADLGRSDIGGKTGTTNNQLDAWFVGFGGDLVATAWVGSDGLTPLGRGEAGGKVALPMWISFMEQVLPSTPTVTVEEPEGIRTVRVDNKTGEAVNAGVDGSLMEIFRSENAPVAERTQTLNVSTQSGSTTNNASGVVAKPKTRSEKKKTKEKVETLF